MARWPLDLSPNRNRCGDTAPPGLLRQLDRSALVVWIVAEDLHAEAAQHVARRGPVIKAPGGATMQNPCVAIANRQAHIMLRAAVELGFTPSSRRRVTLPDPPGSDPADEFFSA